MSLEESVVGVDQTLDRIREEMHVAGNERPDMAERVAEALFVRWQGNPAGPVPTDDELLASARIAYQHGLIFAKAVRGG